MEWAGVHAWGSVAGVAVRLLFPFPLFPLPVLLYCYSFINASATGNGREKHIGSILEVMGK